MGSTSGHTEHSLHSKVALISGSSSGIGAAVAKMLSLRGAHVVINYPCASEESKARAVLLSLRGPAKSIVAEADLSTIEGPYKLVELAVQEFGHIDILVNNAGISGPQSMDDLDDTTFERSWETIVNLNGRGTLLLTRAALRHLSRRDSRIINICSAVARNPEPNMTMYAGTKGMIESFTRCWARDLPRKYGCTVNAIAPGPVATEMMLTAPPEVLALIQATCETTPVAARMGEPSEVAWTVAMLCEDNARWINGTYIPVAGGSTLT